MGKNIKITPKDGIIEFSGATSSSIDLGHNESSDELKFSGATLNPVRLAVKGGYTFNSDSKVLIEGSGEVLSKGQKRIDKGGVWQGPRAQDKGTKGYKGIKGPNAVTAEQGDKGYRGNQGNIGANQAVGTRGNQGPIGNIGGQGSRYQRSTGTRWFNSRPVTNG